MAEAGAGTRLRLRSLLEILIVTEAACRARRLRLVFTRPTILYFHYFTFIIYSLTCSTSIAIKLYFDMWCIYIIIMVLWTEYYNYF